MNHSGTTMPTKAISALLAFAATTTAVCLSILAGWQRGGLLAERVLMVCIGVVLVVAAHLLPALCRPHGWRIRALGVALWIGCVVATCYGHAVFFIMAQKHAGEARAVVVPVAISPGRELAEIAGDRARIVARLARVAERKCGDRCAAVRIERMTLTARLDALDVESGEVKRSQSMIERAEAERTAAKADPLAGLLTAFGVRASRADLVVGLSFAAVLEGVACFCWLLAIRPAGPSTDAIARARKNSHIPLVTPVTSESKTVASASNAATELEKKGSLPTAVQADDVTRVLSAIRDGTLRGTVTEIRKHLGCSQAKAAALRKQLAQHANPVT